MDCRKWISKYSTDCILKYNSNKYVRELKDKEL